MSKINPIIKIAKVQFYRFIVALCGVIGVGMQIYQDGFGMLLYYTVISNILVFSFLFYLIGWEGKNGSINHSSKLLRSKGAVTMAIMITAVVYHFMLAPLAEPHAYWNIRNFLVHYIAPIGFILDTLIIDKKNSYRWFDPLTWTSFPLGYFAFAIFNGMVLQLPIPGAKDSPYAYFFINVNKFGLQKVLINSLIIASAYVVGGYLLLLVKKLVGANCKETVR